MIVTLTPNPSLDLLFAADALVWDDANRLPMPRRRAGGQGINVVRAVMALDDGHPDGHPAAAHPAANAIAPLGGPEGRVLREMLEAEGTPLTSVPIDGETRVFVGVREAASGRSLLLNPRGPTASPADGDAMLAAVDATLEAALPDDHRTSPRDRGSAWLAGCGSLLPGLPDDFYREAGRRAAAHGARFVPDCDGAALVAAVPVADLLVPNALEAGRLVGRAVDGPVAAAEAGIELLDRGPERVVITLGGHGAVACDPDGVWWARPRPPSERAATFAAASTVGAGDAFLAALLLAMSAGAPPEDSLCRAVAAGTAVLLSEGSDLVTPEGAEEAAGWIEVERL